MKKLIICISSFLLAAPAMAADISANDSRDAVNFVWSLPAFNNNAGYQAPPIATSKGYQISVSGKALSEGIALATTAPGFLLAISPRQGAAVIQPQRLSLTSTAGNFDASRAFSKSAGSADLHASGAIFTKGTSAMRASEGLGAGEVVLKSSQRFSTEDFYLVQVLDKHSDVSATLQSTANTKFSDQGASAMVASVAGSSLAKFNVLDAWVGDQQGNRLPATTVDSKQGLLLQADNLSSLSFAPGELADFNATVLVEHNGMKVPRDVKTSFAVIEATAAVSSDPRWQLDRSSNELRLLVPVSVLEAGRYAASAIVVKRNGDIVSGQFAKWLESGDGELAISFTADEQFKGADVYDLRLFDQSRIAVLHRQWHVDAR